ncbi:hypothetical protein [Actinomadura opuntiae]|uniref:hypothetical protein n=1 Tax=Actinomadura sp. OS1-43 TaxID=604315 RepID=UPI00255A8815|nr:hypothetical protein [Actinomadura sp. OS1-43]MDL4819408.1 hypothetical protein [Actinomadura sp. OS1-43]
MHTTAMHMTAQGPAARRIGAAAPGTTDGTGDGMTGGKGAQAAGDGRVGHLRELERELGARGLVARVVRTRSGPAFLRVVNPAAASLAEDVTCAPAPGGHDHYFWWSWGERMHRVDDVDGAAVKLAHVLQPLDEPLDERLDRRSARRMRPAGRP